MDCFTQTSHHIIKLPSLSSTSLPVIPSTSPAILDTQTDTRMSQHAEISSPAHVATTHALALAGYGKNAKIGTKRATRTEISQNITFFSSTTSSDTSLDSTTSSNANKTLETRPKMAVFDQKLENLENSPTLSQKTPPTLSPGTAEHTNDTERVHTSLRTPSNIVLKPPTPNTTASTSPTLGPPAVNLHEKSDLLHASFKSQTPMESLEFKAIATTLETHSALSSFVENYQKLENSPNFTQNDPDPFVPGYPKYPDDVYVFPSSTTIFPDQETRSTTIGFTENDQKVEKSPISTQKAPEQIISGRYKSTNDIDLSLAFTTIVSFFQKRLELSSFMKNYQKIEKTTIFQPKSPKITRFGVFQMEISTEPFATPFILPTKDPCDFSSLHSSRLHFCFDFICHFTTSSLDFSHWLF